VNRDDVKSRNKLKRRKELNGQWKCSTCEEYKSPECFDKNSKAWNGLELNCKECRSHKRKTPIEKERIWEFCLKKRFKLSKEDYNDLLEDQVGVCAICFKADISGRRLSVDHCHGTDEIRGLLCSKCNTGLGLFDDNIDNLVSAINYLKKYII
jgi:hypothetical protein